MTEQQAAILLQSLEELLVILKTIDNRLATIEKLTNKSRIPVSLV